MWLKRSVSFLLVIIMLSSIFSMLPINYAVIQMVPNTTNRQTTIEYWEGDTTITQSKKYTNYEIYINGNLTISSGKTLTLDNSNLIVNSSGDDSFVFKILVAQNSKLELINNSEIKNNLYNDYELEFQEGSLGYIKDSTISRCGFFNETGVVVKSSEVSFINSTFYKNYIGLICFNASPTIINCNFSELQETAVLFNNSINTKLEDCVFYPFSTQYPKLILEAGSKVTLLSTPLEYKGPEVHDSSELTVSWWLSVYINNGTHPVENATVKILDKDKNEVFSGKADENGEINKIELIEYTQNSTLDKNESTPYSITVTKEDYKPLQTSLEDLYEDVDLEIQLLPKPEVGSINGIVKDKAGNGIVNANVSVEIEGIIYWTLTDSDGVYLLTDIPAGQNYSITAKAFINNLSAYETGTIGNVNVTPDQITEVNFELNKKPLPVKLQVISWSQTIDATDAKDVDRDTEIKINFDFPMDLDSVKGNFSLQLDGNETKGVFSSLDDLTSKKFSFKPLKELDWDTLYTIKITQDVIRLDTGALVFWEDYITTFRTEFYPVIDFQPKDGSTNVDTKNPGIFIRFHDKVKLNKTSLGDNVKLYDPADKVVSGWVNIVSNLLNQVQFVPSEELKGETNYTLKIFDALRDLDGNWVFRSGPEFSRSFTTKYVSPEIIITGKLTEKNGDPIKWASVKISNTSFMDSVFSDNVTGIFSITFRGEPGEYKLTIIPKDYKPKEQTITVTEDEYTVDLGNIKLSSLDDDDETEGFVFDQNIIIILIIIIVIIIIIILAIFAMGRRREVSEEEYLGEGAEVSTGRVAAEQTAATTTSTRAETQYTAPPPVAMTTTTTTMPTTSTGTTTAIPETTIIPLVTASAYRCPNCGHRLTITGECFHCLMQQKYGFY